jgi:8-oxo-dGTP pyrophosphatase MutT (NUDIX family)
LLAAINKNHWTISPEYADILSSARRELFEEAGLTADLWLCGTLIIETGQNPGICLYLFSGEVLSGEPQPSPEGLAEWIDYDRLNGLPVVEDLPVLLGRIHALRKGDPPFSGRSFYDEAGQLTVVFA